MSHPPSPAPSLPNIKGGPLTAQNVQEAMGDHPDPALMLWIMDQTEASKKEQAHWTVEEERVMLEAIFNPLHWTGATSKGNPTETAYQAAALFLQTKSHIKTKYRRLYSWEDSIFPFLFCSDRSILLGAEDSITQHCTNRGGWGSLYLECLLLHQPNVVQGSEISSTEVLFAMVFGNYLLKDVMACSSHVTILWHRKPLTHF
ncbi:hypothetical protein OBBRIDRAFT_806315 [Obba rivulosa]|uniref:Uncharacterized protein n=1 Tax=Obba rivulosa TaxID=1052685 RepID=A0A8E2AM68_9APHY|nr:hypothetical protein OBBRIDRAFT_806315 [Obba rivulosa]